MQALIRVPSIFEFVYSCGCDLSKWDYNGTIIVPLLKMKIVCLQCKLPVVYRLLSILLSGLYLGHLGQCKIFHIVKTLSEICGLQECTFILLWFQIFETGSDFGTRWGIRHDQ